MKGSLSERKPVSIDLGKLSLLKVVELLHKEGLLDQPTFNRFSKNHSDSDTIDFLHKFTSGTLDEFNFPNINFTLLDHRRIS